MLYFSEFIFIIALCKYTSGYICKVVLLLSRLHLLESHIHYKLYYSIVDDMDNNLKVYKNYVRYNSEIQYLGL